MSLRKRHLKTDTVNLLDATQYTMSALIQSLNLIIAISLWGK